eukprot:m.259640 g.259640  ORF g.259640 m.259640 type:complete len:123 (+) comp40426_c1_seq4:3247-3615(+)
MALTSNLQAVLENVFDHSSFRPGQYEAASAVLSGKDVVVRMSTSGGKSLCFQLAALAMIDKCCLVVCPLNSLMRDQVQKLQSLNVPVLQVIPDHNCVTELTRNHRILYISPEILLSSLEESS